MDREISIILSMMRWGARFYPRLRAPRVWCTLLKRARQPGRTINWGLRWELLIEIRLTRLA